MAQGVQVADEQRRAVGHIQAEGVEGLQVAASADSDLQPAAGQGIQDGGVLRHAQRQLQRQGDDAGAEAYAAGLGGDVRQEHERGGQSALVAMEVVLGDPGGVEAQALRMDRLGNGEAVTLSRRGVVQDAGEEAKAEPGSGHRASCCGRAG